MADSDSHTFVCPHCGADVPNRAAACPECGSCEETGWAEEIEYSSVDVTGWDEDNNEVSIAPDSDPATIVIPFWKSVAAAMLLLILWYILNGVW